MAHFYGSVQGNRGSVHRLSGANGTLRTIAASWNGGVQVWLSHDKETGKDIADIRLEPHMGHGVSKPLMRIDLATGKKVK